MLIKRVTSESYRLKKTVRGSRNIMSFLPTMKQPSGEASCMNGQDFRSLHLQMTFTSNAATPLEYYSHPLQKEEDWKEDRKIRM
jgi:hypothetical protein